MTIYRVWWREPATSETVAARSAGHPVEQWERSDFEYTEQEARYNANQRQRLDPFLTILVLPDGEQPPPDKPFRPGPPEVIFL